MAVSQAELVDAWRKVLALCKVKPEESVAILTRPGIQLRNLEAAHQAFEELGCQVYQLEPQIRNKPLRENKPAMAALQQTDFILDFIGLHLLRTYELGMITEKGARMLYVTEPPEALVRLLPTQADKKAVCDAGVFMKAAKSMRIESDAGTDLTVALGDFPVLLEWGYTDEPGHWDHWPAGFLATWPNERSANGVVVLDAGDIIFPFKDYVRSPIRLDIREGYIREISGGFDADMLRAFIEEHNDPEAYAVSHLGWGLNPRARWSALQWLLRQTNGNDGRSFAGNFLFSTGPNTDAGGARDTLCHMDIPMRNCSVYLDGRAMTHKGKVLA
ncbi:2,5-dihydroxypyridine 5,6-dioxygenase [Lacisediminimonas sp.]|uniref:2,5-dihydroxypyridine 5,6-dioxygenase n=1 Tax=Lacisediminimonas sp. TaxID=3060582 RepID=UPI00271D775A|nr:2,5-dihydroxypyridine 5,6-dioxygenase [Lacisediminimonas sp.]MDO8299425.1 2,5-dihydroxypyridine 5,6-dioxygenase [Lacisediminimonas sp.]